MLTPLGFALALALYPGAGGASELSSSTPGPQPIIGGESVPVDEWTGVVAIIGVSEGVGFDTAYICTGVLLDPQTALTAAHCFDNADDFSEILVIFGDSIYTSDPSRRTTAVGFAAHPEYCGECSSDTHDFGFVILADAAKGVEMTPPIVTQEEWDEVMGEGTEVTVVGFGAIRDPDEGGSVLGLGMDEIGHKNQVAIPFRNLSRLGLEFVAGEEGKDSCNGDSGGPAFARLADGSWRLIGITSRGVDPCGTGKGIYGAAIAALPWIREATGVDLLPAGCEDGGCVDTTPKEEEGCGCRASDDVGGVAALGLGFGLLGLATARRRRSA